MRCRESAWLQDLRGLSDQETTIQAVLHVVLSALDRDCGTTALPWCDMYRCVLSTIDGLALHQALWGRTDEGDAWGSMMNRRLLKTAEQLRRQLIKVGPVEFQLSNMNFYKVQTSEPEGMVGKDCKLSQLQDRFITTQPLWGFLLANSRCKEVHQCRHFDKL